MGLDTLGLVLLLGAVVVLLAIGGVRLAGRLGIPGLLLYLALGLLLGSVSPWFDFDDPRLATVLGYSALVVILAEGGLSTRVETLRPVLWPSLLLATVGVGVSVAAVALPLMWILGVDSRQALLLGAVLAATDAAAVFSIMRRMRVTARLRALLEAEAGFNDAPVVVLVALLSSSAWGTTPWWTVPLVVLGEIAGGAAVGVAIGWLARWTMPRLALPSVGLYPIAALAFLVASYGLAAVLHSSGFMAVYLAGIVLGSAKRLPHRRSVVGFAEALSWTAEIGLFVMLGMLATAARLPEALGLAVVAGLALVLLGRPLAALVSLLPFRFSWRDVAFVGGAGLRGAVPIVFATIPLGESLEGSELVFDATMLLVFALTLLQAPTLPAWARLLRVEVPPEPHELELESAPLDGMRAVVLGLDVPAGSHLVGAWNTELGLPPGAVLSLVVRDGAPIVPDENTRLRAGDQLVVVTTTQARVATEQRLQAVARAGRLARWRGELGRED